MVPKHNIDNTLNQKQSINLYYKNQFPNNYKIDEHILKKPYQKECSPYWSYQKKNKTYHLLQQI